MAQPVFDGVSLDPFPELKEIAEKELNETAESRAEAIPKLRKLLEELPEEERPADVSDRILLRFLRARKFDVDRAYEVIVNLEKFRRAHPEYFTDLKGEEFREFYGQGFMRVLRTPDKLGRCVSLLMPKRLASADLSVMMRWNMWSMERMSRNPHFQVNGMVIVEDFDNMSVMDSMRMSTKMPPSLMMQSMHYIQKCAAYRLKGIMVFNQPTVMTYMFALVKPFMSQKMKSRVRLLGGDRSVLLDILDEAQLPAEMGGSCEEAQGAWLEEQIEMEARGE